MLANRGASTSSAVPVLLCATLLGACSGLLGYEDVDFQPSTPSDGGISDIRVEGSSDSTQHDGALPEATLDSAGGAGGSAGSAGNGGTLLGGAAGSEDSGVGGSAGEQGGSAGTAGNPNVNRYGIGYVNEGNAQDHDLTAKLAGPGGYVLVIFADVRPDRHTAEQSWKDSISAAYARDLIPVIRMAPPWGNRNVRAMGESPTSYKALAQAYVDILQDLPKRDNWPLYVHVHNEPNLCYEWVCDGSGWLDETALASEYAHLLNDVADAVHAVGDSRLKVTNGALSPGSVLSCECGGDGYTAGTTAVTYLQKMMAAVPGVFDKIDVYASHSYPAAKEGSNFFVDYAQAGPGLRFFEKELQTIGKPGLKVLLTETGWPIEGDGQSWSREQVADFTLQAYQNLWLTHANILGVTPFILRDSSWDKFAWVEVGGNPYPVYNAVRGYRCSQPGALNCQ